MRLPLEGERTTPLPLLDEEKDIRSATQRDVICRTSERAQIVEHRVKLSATLLRCHWLA